MSLCPRACSCCSVTLACSDALCAVCKEALAQAEPAITKQDQLLDDDWLEEASQAALELNKRLIAAGLLKPTEETPEQP